LRKATSERNLGKLCPDLAKEWHPNRNDALTPFGVLPRSNRKVWWRCSKGHEWQATVCNRSYLGDGCPVCYEANRGEIIRKGKLRKTGSLAERKPELAKEWDPTRNGDLKPFNVSPYSDLKVWWVCGRGHQWQATVASRSVGSGCPKCFHERMRRH
jgi:Probable Zinc-ribbon domain